MFELYQSRVVDQIKQAKIDPYNYNRLTFLALQIAKVPLEIFHAEIQIPGSQYNPSQDELVLAQNAESAEAIRDLIDTMPATNILSLAKFVSMGKPGFIIPFFTEDADLRAWAIHEKQIDDIGGDLIETITVKKCYLTAYERQAPNPDHNSEYSIVDGISVNYHQEFIDQGLKTAPPELVAAWMSQAYSTRLREKKDLAELIFAQNEEDLSQTA